MKKRTYSTCGVIDLTVSSDEESIEENLRTDLIDDFATEILTLDEPLHHVTSKTLKVPKIKKICTEVTRDMYCTTAAGANPVFIPLQNRFYCFCYKIQEKHRHEKYLAMKGLTSDRCIYWTCRTRALSSTSGCTFFAWDPITRTLD